MAIRPRVRNLYYLKLIEPKNKQINALSFKRKAIDQWIDDLPTINKGMVTRQFHDKIKQINNTIIDFQEQFDTLEALQPMYYTIEEFLHSKICGQYLPLSEQVQKIVVLHVDILHEYANAYWYLLKTGAQQPGGRSFVKKMPVLVHRLIRLLGNILKTHYLANLAEPTWIWMDIHSLFNILPDKTCEKSKIREYAISGEANTTIADTYKQIIALSTADPFGMYNREILRTNHFLTRWAPAIKLEKIAPGLIPLGYFVSMDDDKAPSWATISVDLDEESDIYQIYMDDMIKLMLKESDVVQTNLGRYYAATAYPFTHNCFDHELIKHLQRQWEGKPLRQPVTFDSSLHREVAIGLNAISQALIDINNNKTPALFQAEVAAGKNLKCSLDSGNQVAIGSLVSYRKADSDKHHFGLGIISRMFTPNTESDTQFELKNITNSVQAVTIELVVEDNKKTKDKKTIEKDPNYSHTTALSFQKRNNGKIRHFLVIESRSFKVDDTIVIHDSGQSYGAVLIKQNNLGLAYVILEYQSITVVKQLEAIPVTGYDFL
ncbi:MAG TPA: hypothetical protein ENJ32_01535 [Crenotrichaceae bacterium]|nr:hypothetical protein [Crenotrichaceae bacterium]